MAGWHHWLDGRESEWTLGVGDGQGGLACCNSWGRKESDTTERLNWTEINKQSKTNIFRSDEKTTCNSMLIKRDTKKSKIKDEIYVKWKSILKKFSIAIYLWEKLDDKVRDIIGNKQ